MHRNKVNKKGGKNPSWDIARELTPEVDLWPLYVHTNEYARTQKVEQTQGLAIWHPASINFFRVTTSFPGPAKLEVILYLSVEVVSGKA